LLSDARHSASTTPWRLSRCSAWYRAASSPRRGHARLRIKLAARQDAALELLVVGVILAMMLILSLR
jgi:hypothetical protein